MTEATQTRAYNQAIIIPSLQYWVAIPKPESHLFEVTLRIQKDIISSSVLDLKMPVWTPGSYLVREYSRHLQDFAVRDQDGSPLNWQKLVKIIGELQLIPPQKSQLIIEFLRMN